MSREAPGATVIGVGNPFRRDDGAGPETVARLRDRVPTGVTVTAVDGEPTGLMEAWAGAALAIVVDTVVCDPPDPGRIHRVTAPASLPVGMSVATHGMGVVEAVRLAAALDRLPRTLVLFGVEAADVGIGPGLSPQVAAAMPALVSAVLAELEAAGPSVVDGGRAGRADRALDGPGRDVGVTAEAGEPALETYQAGQDADIVNHRQASLALLDQPQPDLLGGLAEAD